MKRLKISSGSQITFPAAIRKRWRTSTVTLEDRGDEVVLRPAPDDPVAAAAGALKGRMRYTSDQLRRMAREEDRRAEERKWGRS